MESFWILLRPILLVVLAIVVDLMVWGGIHTTRWGSGFPVWLIPVTTIVVFSSLLLHRRFPMSVFAVQFAYSLVGIVVPGYQPFVGLLATVHLVARVAPPRQARLVLVLSVLPFAVDCFDLASRNREFGAVFVVTALLWAVITGTVWGLGRLAYAGAQRAAETQKREAEEAVRAERLRLARELHDIVAHAVSVMVLQAAGARTLLGTEDIDVSRALVAIEDAGVRAMDELHRLLAVLRQAGAVERVDFPDDLPSVVHLEELVTAVAPPGLDVEVSVQGAPVPLDGSVDLACYRVLQECMTNTLKHGAAGSSVRVLAVWKDEQLELLVTDRAASQSTAPAYLSSGHGLSGLRERVMLLGGSCEYGAIVGGWKVKVVLPLPAKAGVGARPAGIGSRGEKWSPQ